MATSLAVDANVMCCLKEGILGFLYAYKTFGCRNKLTTIKGNVSLGQYVYTAFCAQKQGGDIH